MGARPRTSVLPWHQARREGYIPEFLRDVLGEVVTRAEFGVEREETVVPVPFPEPGSNFRIASSVEATNESMDVRNATITLKLEASNPLQLTDGGTDSLTELGPGSFRVRPPRSGPRRAVAIGIPIRQCDEPLPVRHRR